MPPFWRLYRTPAGFTSLVCRSPSPLPPPPHRTLPCKPAAAPAPSGPAAHRPPPTARCPILVGHIMPLAAPLQTRRPLPPPSGPAASRLPPASRPFALPLPDFGGAYHAPRSLANPLRSYRPPPTPSRRTPLAPSRQVFCLGLALHRSCARSHPLSYSLSMSST
ncbi:hypothetical protein B0H11DRAFT_2266553 [Mycena galericulata]|nr:hypothetical protein B0H11DRAFT_2266553 [Mycena galericulata]